MTRLHGLRKKKGKKIIVIITKGQVKKRERKERMRGRVRMGSMKQHLKGESKTEREL